MFASRALDVAFTFRIAQGGASGSGTSFEFTTEEDAMVSLKIFDLRGREVRNLAQGFMAAGPHQASLGERSLHAGRYVARLQVGPGRQQRSFDILR